MPELEGYLSVEDLAFYVVLSSIVTLTRNELRENVIANSTILSLMEMVPDTIEILDNFRMGRYEAF